MPIPDWKLPHLHRVDMDADLNRLAVILLELEARRPDPIPIQPPDDAKLLLKRRLASVAFIAQCKLHVMVRSIHSAARSGDWTTYALVGRALVEQAANLRHYFWKRVGPTEVQTEDERERVLDELGRFVFAGRYDWTQRLSDLGPASQSTQEQPNQVNVLTCIDSWAKIEPCVRDLYSEFCDLAHPNLGSALLVMGIDEQAVAFLSTGPESIGRRITERSIGGLADMAEHASATVKLLLFHAGD
jgi:hypothetical protein